MKKLLIILSSIVLCLSLALFAACGTDNAGGGNTSDDTDNDGDFVYYTVTFDSLGGSAVESQKILAGNPARAPSSPVRENFDFVGWYKSEDGEDIWNFFTDRVDKNLTLYARWTDGQAQTEATPTLQFELQSGNYVVTGDSGQAANIVIPAVHEGRPVVAVADGAFAYSKHTSDILSITIPDSVTEIGKNAFHNQRALEVVNIGAGSKLEKIGNNAFSGNGALKSIYLPASLTLIGDDVFNNCGGLETIEVAAENIHYSGAGNCLIDLATNTLIRGSNRSVIPDTVQTIGEAAFRDATLTELTVPASVTYIGKYAIQDSAIERIIYGGTREQWEDAVKSFHKSWNMGKTGVEIIFSGE